jgi:hypothetical protein
MGWPGCTLEPTAVNRRLNVNARVTGAKEAHLGLAALADTRLRGQGHLGHNLTPANRRTDPWHDRDHLASVHGTHLYWLSS